MRVMKVTEEGRVIGCVKEHDNGKLNSGGDALGTPTTDCYKEEGRHWLSKNIDGKGGGEGDAAI